MGRTKKAEIDQLSIDSSNAIKAGMSYGRYMATKKTFIKESPTSNPDFIGYKHTCQFCGKDFVVYNKKARKFCSDRCREQSYNDKQKTNPVLKTCSICGKEFMTKSHREKYCSEFCVRVAHGQRMKEYLARKAGEEKCNG